MKSMLLRPATPTWKAILNVGGQYCHVHRPKPFYRLESTYAEAAAPSEAPSNVDENTKNFDNENSLHRPRQVTLHTRFPNTITRGEVITALRIFRQTADAWGVFTRDRNQALIILATPTFSKWLEDDSFIASLLGKLARTGPKAKKSPSKRRNAIEDGTFDPLEMDVVCACVDGLSPHIDSFHLADHRSSKQGFSILQGRSSSLLPKLWDAEDSTTSSPTMTASLTFSKGRKSRNQAEVVLPLANTLFSNGRHSTLLVSKWRSEKDSFVKVKAAEKRNQIIKLFDNRKQSIPFVYVPAIPLTPARRIISGLGNIVRQIDFGNEDAGPASRELEATIDEYLDYTGREKSNVAVWALIVPKDSLSQRKLISSYELLYEPGPVRSYWQEIPPNPNFIGYWVSRGARFCRVLSGGGGWGVKQGLLSLDPQSTYGEINEARFDFSTGSLEEQQASALGNLAEQDAHIQFFITDDTFSSTHPQPAKSEKPPGVDVWQRTTAIGTIPSTIDDQRIDNPGPATLKDVKVILEAGHFGAVSEAGMYLSTRPKTQKAPEAADKISTLPAVLTKIDLPYSYAWRDFRVEAKPGISFQSKASAQASRQSEPKFTITKYDSRPTNPSTTDKDREPGPPIQIRRTWVSPPEKFEFYQNEITYAIQEPELQSRKLSRDQAENLALPVQETEEPIIRIRRDPLFVKSEEDLKEPTRRTKTHLAYSDAKESTFRIRTQWVNSSHVVDTVEAPDISWRIHKQYTDSLRIRKVNIEFDPVPQKALEVKIRRYALIPPSGLSIITRYNWDRPAIRKTSKFPRLGG